MKYLLDASAVYKIAELNRLDIIENSETLDLARYELGNATLKDCTMHRRLDAIKAQQLIKFLYELLDTMDRVSLTDGQEAIKTALDFKISFYDAAYVYYSKASNLTFITEDEKLVKRVKDYITVADVSALLK